jgi:hypothetical protein
MAFSLAHLPPSASEILKNPDEDELEYEYDFRSDCEDRALSDRREISLGSNRSNNRRLPIVLAIFLGVVMQNRAHGAKHMQNAGLSPAATVGQGPF